MKKFLILAMLICLALTLFGCGKNETGSAYSSNTASASAPLSTSAATFKSIAELKESVSKDETIPDDIPLFEVNLGLESFSLSEITLSGNNIYYRFVLDGFSYYDNNKEDKKEEPTAIGKEPSSEESKAENEPDVDESFSFLNQVKNTISVGWNFTGNGEAGLEHFVSENSEYIFPVDGQEGLYYSNSTDDSGTVLGKVLYWAQDDCNFELSVPEEFFELLLGKIKQDDSFIKKIE